MENKSNKKVKLDLDAINKECKKYSLSNHSLYRYQFSYFCLLLECIVERNLI